MIAFLALIRRVPVWLWIALAFVLVCLAMVIAIDRSVDKRASDAVAADRSAVSVEVLARQVAAEREATANQMMRDDAARDDQEELNNVVREKGNDGTAVQSVLERMRAQQAAGRR